MYGRADDDPDEDDRDGWAYSYSQFDDLTARWTVKDGPGVEFRYFYNSKGALARVEQYSTTVVNDEVTSRTLVNTERYYYDATDRLIRVWETDANGNQHEFRWTYDSNDQVTELVETVNGQSFTYANSYNGDKQPTQSSYGSVLESFTYDGLGRLSQSAVSNSGNSNVLTTDYSFRDLDATRTTTQVAEVRNRYGLSDEDITYTYDVKGNIASVSFSRTVTEPDPEPTPTPTPPPTPTPTPEPTPTPTPDPTPTPEPPLVTMDPVIPIVPTPTPPGEIMSGGNGGSGSSTSSTTTVTVTIYYEYDALNELTWEKNELEEKAWHYSYDLGGNILSKTEYSYQNGTVGSTALSTVTYTYGDSDWPDLLTAYNGSPITHDGIGNPLSYRGWLFTWQGGRQLAAASDGTTRLNFAYNESGLRTEKNDGSDTHRYVYRGSTLVAEIADSYALYFHHDARGEIVGFTYASGSTQTEYFYRKNLQGDVIGIVDATGSSVAEYAYDAWGQILDATGSMAEINPIRFRGYYFDQETGLYYVSSRYYDPEICRWINADSTSYLGASGDFVSFNLFAYCGNNPIVRTDPTGTAWGHWIAAAAIVAVCAVATIVTCGGFAAAAMAVGMVSSGVAAATTASTVATAAFIGSATVLGASAMIALDQSHSAEEFAEQGNWGTVAATATGGLVNGVYGYQLAKPAPAPQAQAQHLSGSGSPKNNATPNGSFTKMDSKGNVYSYTEFDSQSRQYMRIDFQGKPHAGVLPHIHLYKYLEKGGCVKYTFNMNWELID